ncbi:MAG TPA: right-handed parallel beta-helix repeat-containing protein, partial [Minicystis sp.]|nr:right-handed parallel beta-helix repeat-containing protein [Minicystis sp.]
CDAGAFPDAPSGAKSIAYASAACPSAGADGTKEHPFPTITAAIAKAGHGGTVLVAAGTYRENLSIDDDVAVVGPGAVGQKGDDAGIILQAPNPYAVEVLAGATATLRGFDVKGAAGVGVWAKGGSADLAESKIEGTLADGGQVGHGLLATDDGAIILQDGAVLGAAGVGVLFSGGKGSVESSTVSRNAAGGVRLDEASDQVTVHDDVIESNASFGVGVFSSVAIILQNQVRDTALDDAMSGDGIVVGAGVDASGDMLGAASVTAKGNHVDGSGRVGILCTAGAHGIILQDNVVTASAAAAPFGAGIWLQEGAGADGDANAISGNHVTGSRYVGIGMASDTHAIILQDNEVTGTVSAETILDVGTAKIGDGLNLFAGASTRATNNHFEQNGRFGVLIDAAAASATSVKDNIIRDNDEYGIILQDQADMPDVAGNHFGGNGPSGHDDTTTVPAMTYGKPPAAF